MKTILLAGVALFAVTTTASADSSAVVTMESPAVTCSGWCGGWDNEPQYHLTGCDSNEKTPDEALQCKLDYWRKEIETRQKALDKAQKDLDFAKDRVGAFERAAKH